MTHKPRKLCRSAIALTLVAGLASAEWVVEGGRAFASDRMWTPVTPGFPIDLGSVEMVEGFEVAAGGTDLADTPAGAAMELVRQGEWVAAIQAIEDLREEDGHMVLDDNGVLRPVSWMRAR